MKKDAIPELPLAALKTLQRYISYGWMPAVTSNLLNRQFNLSLTARDITLILSQPDPFAACAEDETSSEEPENT